MLSDRIKKLLAAAIENDGALDPRRRRAVARLLEQSREARHFYKRLQRDRSRLKNLPRHRLPSQFISDVMSAVSQANQPSPSTVVRPVSRFLPRWANLAAAVAVMLVVALGTYLAVTISDQQRAVELAAARRAAASREELPARGSVDVNRTARTPTPPTVDEPDQLPLPREDDTIVASPLPELPDSPEPEDRTVLTVPFNPKLELFKVEMPRLPPILSIREMDQAKQRAALLESLNGEGGFHLDLFCEDANRGFERVLNSLRSQGKRVLVEALAQQRLHARAKTNYVIFSETLTADDVAKLFAALAAEERRSEGHLIEKLVVVPLSLQSQKTLAALLGVDVKQLNLRGRSGAAADPMRPLSDSTADALAKALADKERNGRSSEPALLAMSFNPIRPNPASSREVRSFLAGRKERKPDSPALMIVIRNLD